MGASKRDEERPFEDTDATRMLKTALAGAAEHRGLSTRAAARELGYKATVVISHMATGRVPIPLDRAADIARVVGLDEREFFLAVLEQRHPGALRTLGILTHQGGDGDGDGFIAELQMIAGGRLDELPAEHKAVLREVVAERSPQRRWLTLAELPTAVLLRRLRPGMREAGLNAAEIAGIEETLGATDG